MEIKHKAQRKILNNLLFMPGSRFSQLNTTNLDNNHFNFHLKQLIKSGLVEKTDDIYRLTPEGLEVAGRLDTKTKTFIRQPKIGVCIFIKNEKGEILLGKRLKDPGKGKYYFYTKKLQFGKPATITASECLNYETGLTAEFEYTGNIRHIKNDYDVVFVCFKAKDISGNLKKKTKESENYWVDLNNTKELDVYPFFKGELDLFFSNKIFFKEFVE